ncbi:hypothetical protein BD410DRAFT_783894, partial [Rickenella mellea]
MPSSTTNLCQAQASYKKAPGLLELTQSHIQWTPAAKNAPSIRVPHAQAASLFCSKEGSPQVKLKLGLVGNDAGHTFMFTSPAPVANAEREAFKKELTNIISANRSGQKDSTIISNPSPRTPLGASNVPSPRPASRATSVSSNGRSSSSTATRPIDDFRIRKKVLMKTPELAALHRELVISGQITEHEFWEGREHLLLAAAAQESQKRGRPGQLVDPRPEAVENGDVRIVITPQLVHDIFEEYPVVMKAYNETVPTQLSEAEFWKRYFQSKLFHSHRASIRSTATQHVVKDDPIFDQYIEKVDDELEPRRQRGGDVDLIIDLYATQEDHIETGNEKDVTMQAGKQRGALPLIRRFNEHSERLLNSAMGSPAKKRRIEGADSDAYSQIDLDDLHDSESTAGIMLEMQDRNRYFEGRAVVAKEDAEDKVVDVRSTLRHLKEQMPDWLANLSTLKIDKKASDAAFASMTRNVQARVEVKTRKNDIPEGIFRQMTTCQTAANEFLRQFWSSVYPPPSELQTIAVSTPAQKAAKATKMAGYLMKTREKVDALVKAAQKADVDPTRVEVGMKPVLDAVDVALQFYRTRKLPTR